MGVNPPAKYCKCFKEKYKACSYAIAIYVRIDQAVERNGGVVGGGIEAGAGHNVAIEAGAGGGVELIDSEEELIQKYEELICVDFGTLVTTVVGALVVGIGINPPVEYCKCFKEKHKLLTLSLSLSQNISLCFFFSLMAQPPQPSQPSFGSRIIQTLIPSWISDITLFRQTDREEIVSKRNTLLVVTTVVGTLMFGMGVNPPVKYCKCFKEKHKVCSCTIAIYVWEFIMSEALVTCLLVIKFRVGHLCFFFSLMAQPPQPSQPSFGSRIIQTLIPSWVADITLFRQTDREEIVSKRNTLLAVTTVVGALVFVMGVNPLAEYCKCFKEKHKVCSCTIAIYVQFINLLLLCLLIGYWCILTTFLRLKLWVIMLCMCCVLAIFALSVRRHIDQAVEGNGGVVGGGIEAGTGHNVAIEAGVGWGFEEGA
ncbi:unnamed protein product [Prunus brigantina]